MDLYSVLVTGANRGIGLEFVRQLAKLPKPPRFIFATYRSSESLGALTEIKDTSKSCQFTLIKMDVRNPKDVSAARKVVEQAVGENGLTLLINNAGVGTFLRFPNITEENMMKHFIVNTIGPIRLFQEFLPLLRKAAARGAFAGGMRISRAAVLNISSECGSITRTGVEMPRSLAAPAYSISKAGLNMAMRTFAANVKSQGILVIMMSPGSVKTDMNTDTAEITVEESISAMLQTLEKLDDSHHGAFMDRFGNPYEF